MSSPDTDTIGGTSFLGNLSNKIAYKANKLAYDPNAEKYAKEKEEKKKQLAEQKKEKNTSTDTTDTTDPTKFSVRRFAKKTSDQFVKVITNLLPPFFALMATMVVTNDMIVYSVPVRIIFFIVTLALCLFAPFYSIIIAFVYLFRALYSFYANSGKPDSQKRDYLPTIFALLPIKLTIPETNLGRFFMYPFTYPKTEEARLKLPKIMETYENDLEKSFNDFDKYKSMPMFSKILSKIHSFLRNMHSTNVVLNTSPKSEPEQEPEPESEPEPEPEPAH